MNVKDGHGQRAAQHSALQSKAQKFGIQPCPGHPGILSSLNPPRTFSKPKHSETGMQGLNSTDIPSPTGSHFPSCSHSGAGSREHPGGLGRGVYLIPATCGRCGAGLSRALLAKLLLFVPCTSLVTRAGTGTHCPSQAPGAQGGGLTLIVSGQINNGVSASAWNSSDGSARDTCVGKSTAWGETPGRRSWDVNLGVLCHRGTDVLRGRLPLLLPQLCFGSVDRCLKPSLALCSPILTWLKAGSAHSTPPSTPGLQLAYSWVFLPTFGGCQAYTSHHDVSLWFLKCLLVQAAGS